jgi:cephalosporin-C deacetylase
MIEIPYEIPLDFEEFWKETLQEALDAPIDISNLKINAFPHNSHLVESFSFRGVDGQAKHGWVAFPEGARSLPGFLWIPPYGRESKLPDEYGTRQGMVSMSFNLHGESAFHQESYTPERGYFAQGADDPYEWIFRRFFQDCVIALRIMQALVQVDSGRIGVSGMSQGGGLSIWLGAWAPMVRAVCADMPFGCAFGYTVQNYAYRYPLKEVKDFIDSIPVGEARVLNTMSYYDTVFQAQRCTVPTHVSLGLKDPASRPPNVEAAYDQLTGIRHLEKLDWGHDWHPSMIENNREWFLNYL